MTNKHTPGPWIVAFNPNDGFGRPMFGNHYVRSGCSVVAHDCRCAEDAAPELLAAGRNLLAHIEDIVPDDVWDKIDTATWNAFSSAIAKAEGR